MSGDNYTADVLAMFGDRDLALSFHLTSRVFPPVPQHLLPAVSAMCSEALDAYDDMEFKDGPVVLVTLPEGVSIQGRTQASPYAIVEALNLWCFL